MSKKLFVGNLNYRTTDETLYDAFAAIGSVESATVITDRETGRSRGFGFVEMASDADAQAAIQQLDSSELDGRTMATARAAADPVTAVTAAGPVTAATAAGVAIRHRSAPQQGGE